MTRWLHCAFSAVIVTAIFLYLISTKERTRSLYFFARGQYEQEHGLQRNSSTAIKANLISFHDLIEQGRLQRNISNPVKSESNAFIDLTEEFEEKTGHLSASFNVLEAIANDGYTLKAVSVRQTNENSQANTDRGITDVGLSTTSSVSARKPDGNGKTSTPAAVLHVPNVVHYVSLGSDLNFSFVNYLSYLSVDRFLKPEQIFVFGDRVPRGHWWNRTVAEVKNIYHVTVNYSENAPNGVPYKYRAHISDNVRAKILLRYGGIYLDADVLVVKSFKPLRQYSATVIGRQDTDGLCNGIMIAKRGAPFLRLLLEQYRSYEGARELWSQKSVLNPHSLAKLYPHLVHVEEATLNRPNWVQSRKIYDEWYDWTKNYAVHLWVRVWPAEKKPNGVEDILTRNTTFGELARVIMFGSREVRNSTVDDNMGMDE